MKHSRFNLMSIPDAAGIVATVLVVALVLAACGGETRADAETWDIEGTLLAWEAGVWIVDAVPIVVSDDLALNDDPTLGATVTASGVYDADGRRIANEVSVEAGQQPESTLPEIALTGTIERIDGNLWIIDGQEVVVANGTPLRSTEPGTDPTALLQLGSVAEVAGNQMSAERIVAREILLRPADGGERPEPAPPAPNDTQPDESDNGDDSDDSGDDDDDDDDD